MPGVISSYRSLRCIISAILFSCFTSVGRYSVISVMPVVLTFADVAGPSFTARGVARVAVHGMNDRYALSGGG